MNSKVFFRRMTAVWIVKTQRKRISSHLKNGSPIKPMYKLVCEENVFCYRDVLSYLKANYPKSLQFALKITSALEIHWMMFFLLLCLLPPSPASLFALNFKSVFSLQRFFGVKSSPARIYSRRSCVCYSVPFAREIAWDLPIGNIVSQTLKEQALPKYFGHWWEIAFTRMLPRNKKCVVTSNYCVTSWGTPSELYIYKKRWALRVCSSLGSTRGPRTARALRARRDYKLTLLGASHLASQGIIIIIIIIIITINHNSFKQKKKKKKRKKKKRKKN